jgi:aryl-alcohol dehydrogenase-like predicted oxidoreductase
MRSRRAVPWIDTKCCGRREIVDMKVEQLGTGKLPEKYEQELIEFFGTDDKRKMLNRALKSRRVPVFCKSCNTMELVDVSTGKTIRKIADDISGLSYTENSDIPPRRLGKHGPLVPMLGLGGQGVFQYGTMKQSEDVFDAAMDAGIRYIDTAHDYGESQERLGKLMKGIDFNLFVATKIGKRERDDFLRELDENLERLGRVPDLLQVHAIHKGEVEPGINAVELANEAKSNGKCKYVGITGHSDSQTMENILRMSDGIDCALVSLSPADIRFIEEFIPVARQRGLGIVAMKIMSRGMLVRPSGPGVRTSEEALRFALSNNVDVGIVGFSFSEEVEELANIAKEFTPMRASEMTDLVNGTAIYADEVTFYRPGVEAWDEQVERLRPSPDWFFGEEVGD